jgi:hypothetical protein
MALADLDRDQSWWRSGFIPKERRKIYLVLKKKKVTSWVSASYDDCQINVLRRVYCVAVLM